MAYWVWGAWIVAGAVGLASLAAALGATYQVVGERADLERYPPPGRLVDVKGRRLHLYCAGKRDGPAVVIEAGAGNDSTLWADIVQRVSSFAKVCTYDRAGLGWSDPAPLPMTIEDRANDQPTAQLNRRGLLGSVVSWDYHRERPMSSPRKAGTWSNSASHRQSSRR